MDAMSHRGEDELDLGGERACWLDEVCVSCGAIHGHRPGCDLADASAPSEMAPIRRTVPLPGPPQADGEPRPDRTISP